MGRLAGIARHNAPKAQIETIDSARVTLAGGIEGDHRGGLKGRPYNRQVTLIEAGDWAAAIAEVGANLPWWERRANLLVDAVDLPQRPGARLRIGADVVLEVTDETAPCERMEALSLGLRAALTPDWRGGVLAKVISEGDICIGDAIVLEG